MAFRKSKERCEGCNEPEILERNLKNVLIFFTVKTQINVSPGGDVIGFRMEGVESALRMAGIELEQGDFAMLRLVESFYISAMHDFKKRAQTGKV